MNIEFSRNILDSSMKRNFNNEENHLLDSRMLGQHRVELRDITNLPSHHENLLVKDVKDHNFEKKEESNKSSKTENLDSQDHQQNKSQISTESYESESVNNSFFKFKLEKRKSPAHLCSSKRLTHKYLPYQFKNNSKYKRRLISYLRRDVGQTSKTESCRQHVLYKASFKCHGNFGNMIKNITAPRGTEAKTQVQTSKSFIGKENQYLLSDPSTNENKLFLLFEEDSVGFTSEWQKQLKITEMDDDVETDEDQLEAAARHIKKEVKEVSYILYDGLSKIRNVTRFKSLFGERPIFVMK